MGKRRSRADNAPALPCQHRRALASDELMELPGLHIVDSAGDGDVIRYEVGVSERLDVVAHALFEVGEREEVAASGVHTEVFLYLRRQVLVTEGQHPAVRVVDGVTTHRRYASPPRWATSRRSSSWGRHDLPPREALCACRVTSTSCYGHFRGNTLAFYHSVPYSRCHARGGPVMESTRSMQSDTGVDPRELLDAVDAYLVRYGGNFVPELGSSAPGPRLHTAER